MGDPKPVDGEEEFDFDEEYMYADLDGRASLLAEHDAAIRAERDAYWKGRVRETLSGTWANGWTYRNAHPTVEWTGNPTLSRARADWVNTIMAEVLGNDDE
jgi:hypothetical protein